MIKEIIYYLKEGKTILYPTDTVWGIGCDAISEQAVQKIYRLKNREESKALIVLVSSMDMLEKYVSVPKEAVMFLKKAENPTTIIYPNPNGLARNLINKKDNTVAIRITQDEFCQKLIRKFGRPIVSTSANISGKPTPKSFSEINQPILEGVDYIVNLHKDRANTKSSKIIKIDGDTIQILRP